MPFLAAVRLLARVANAQGTGILQACLGRRQISAMLWYHCSFIRGHPFLEYAYPAEQETHCHCNSGPIQLKMQVGNVLKTSVCPVAARHKSCKGAC